MEIRERTPKYKLYTALIYLCAYLLIVAFPFDLFLSRDHHLLAITALKFILFVYMVAQLKKEGFSIEPFSWKKSLLFIPTLLLCCSNFVFLAINKGPIDSKPDYLNLINGAVSCAATALCEELIFRVMASDVAKTKFNKILTLVITAGIFGAVHFIARVFGDPFGATIQAGYSLFLGLVVGFTYLYGGSLISAVLIHFLFNFINDSLFAVIHAGDWNGTFYIVNLCVGLLVAIYLFILFVFFKKIVKDN
ncbi:MAG: CPBP family intramembrane metalloprotease [Bacilli bacterium]|nr:CPBP family intramembrane metalloprotease [Bacilli bacterium]